MENGLTGQIVDGMCVRQSFTFPGGFLRSISILMSTYKRTNSGRVSVFVAKSGNFNKISKIATRDASTLVDNAWQEFVVNVKLVPGTYDLVIQTLHCRSGRSFSAHHEVKNGDGHLFVGSRLVRGRQLMFRLECNSEASYALSLPNLSLLPKKAASQEMEAFLGETEETLSVVVLTKDRPDLLEKCLRFVAEQKTDFPVDVVVGDTGSVEEATFRLYERLPSSVKVVKGLTYNFSATNNLLVREYAKGNRVLFLNNDVFLGAGALSAMMEQARIFKVGAVGLRLIKPRGVIDHDGQILRDGNGKVLVPNHVNINIPPNQLDTKTAVTDGVTGACMLTRKALFLSSGGFDEKYQDVYQDCDYCMRLAEMGFRCVTVRSVSAGHVGSATRGPTTKDRLSVVADIGKYMEAWERRGVKPGPTFSFVTCCNDAVMYRGMVDSLPEAGSGFAEFVPVMNFGNHMSVTRALNAGMLAATGKWMVCCHQDVLFCRGWMGKMSGELNALPGAKVGVVGFEGLQDGGTPRTCKATRKPAKVQTLDELCLVMPKGRLDFDERFKFHYYGADICMQAEAAGLTNWLVGVIVTHLSGGDVNIKKDPDGFKAEARNFMEKWAGRDVWTTTTIFSRGGVRFMILPRLLNEEKAWPR